MKQPEITEASRTALSTGKFKKHHATVFTCGYPSVVARKAYNALVENAFPFLQEDRLHTLPISVLLREIGHKGNDRNYFEETVKPALVGLRRSSIEWIRQEEDGHISIDADWAEFGFLSSVSVSHKSNSVSYSFDPFVRAGLSNPKTYAQLHKQAQRRLSSKDKSYPLYEMLADFRPNEKTGFPGLTPWWTIEYMCRCLDLEGSTYRLFKHFNDRILKPCLKRINDENATDIFVSLSGTRKTGRAITHVQFKVANNLQQIFPFQDESINPDLHKTLVSFGIAPLHASQLIEDHERRYLEEKVDYVRSTLATGTHIDNPAGYLLKAIELNWIKREPRKVLAHASHEKAERAQAREAETLFRQQRESERVAEENARARAQAEAVRAWLKTLSPAKIEELKTRFPSEGIDSELLRAKWTANPDPNASIFSAHWHRWLARQMPGKSVPTHAH